MAESTKIEWCDATFNPWIGCTKVSPGCDHCYAECGTPARTLKVNWGPGAPRRRTSVSNWKMPLAWNAQADAFFAQHGRRRRVFCASLADWLDNAVEIEWFVELLQLVRSTPNLDWLLLTKRIGNWKGRLVAALKWTVEHGSDQGLAEWISDWLDGAAPANVWLGATIVNQPEADRDVSKLLNVPARARFLSMEPLLGPVDLSVIDINGDCEIYPLRGTTECVDDEGRSAPDLPALDWVIVGGESGRGARPMNPEWVRSLRDQCEAAGVPYLLKQWGEWGEPDSVERTGLAHEGWFEKDRLDGGVPRHEWPGPMQNGVELASLRPEVFRVGKKAAGRLLDGRTHDGYPAP